MADLLHVLLLQLPVPNNPGANIPLAAGYLKAWAAHEGLLAQLDIEIMPRRIADHAGDALLVDAIVERRPHVLGLSLYTWNSERSLAIARRARQALPGLLVVVGGPEVQADNDWVLRHPAVDLAVLGEGEQTFVELLRALVGPAGSSTHGRPDSAGAGPGMPAAELLAGIAGLSFRRGDELICTPPRAALDDLSVVPSPYLLGYLELRPGEMALVECSRWCPYRCSFCLYGRNMGTRLGRRYFPCERVLAEVAWARAQGAAAVHFVEANLNLLPYFRALMQGLQELNGDRQLRLYAELRGEHLSDEAVDALLAAGLYAAEVGLQSANPEALIAVDRRTNLERWAAGARRLYARGVEVFLDVILGLPEDDRGSVLRTLDWIGEQQLGPYDCFILQLLPGTGVRAEADRWGLRFQDRPPYYVLETERLSYSELRALRWELRERAGLDPQTVEGMPHPLFETRALALEPPRGLRLSGAPVELVEIDCSARLDWQAEGQHLARQVAQHLTVLVHQPDLDALRALCWPIAEANPGIHWDVVFVGVPAPQALGQLRADWPHEIGYLDRIAVYRQPLPVPPYAKASPRFFVLGTLDRSTQPAVSYGRGTAAAGPLAVLDPLAYEGLAEVLWLIAREALPSTLEHIEQHGGSGLLLAGPAEAAAAELLAAWRERTGWRVWQAAAVPAGRNKL